MKTFTNLYAYAFLEGMTVSGVILDVTDWDSNYREKTQMLLKKTQMRIHQGGEGGIGVFFSNILKFL